METLAERPWRDGLARSRDTRRMEGVFRGEAGVEVVPVGGVVVDAAVESRDCRTEESPDGSLAVAPIECLEFRRRAPLSLVRLKDRSGLLAGPGVEGVELIVAKPAAGRSRVDR